jgi:hypothetical protein
MAGLTKKDLRDFIKYNIIECVKSDPDFREALFDVLREHSQEVLGIPTPKREPANTEMWDDLVLVATGKMESYEYNGFTLDSPNEGMGFKNKKMIEEWVRKAYTKMGGDWQTIDSPAYNMYGNHDSDTSSFAQSMMGGLRQEMTSVEDSGYGGAFNIPDTSQVMTMLETNQNATKMTSLDGGNGMDLTSLLKDTAKRTYPTYAKGARNMFSSAPSGPADVYDQVVEAAPLGDLFGKQGAGGGWAAILDGMSKKK